MHLVWFSFGWIEKKGECPPQKISHFLCKIWFVLTKKVTARDVRLTVQPLYMCLITHFLSDKIPKMETIIMLILPNKLGFRFLL